MLALGEADDAAIRFKPSQVALIDALLAAQPARRLGRRIRTRARGACGASSASSAEDPPATFHGELRDYQRESLGWMRFLRDFGFGGCLADDMGLGKTVMVLAMLEARRTDPDRRHRPSLVVMPRSLIFNWTSEAARFAPQLRVLDFAHAERHGAHRRDRPTPISCSPHTARCAATSPALQHQPSTTSSSTRRRRSRTPATATAKAVRLLRADHRLALTGTPVENHLGELYSLFEFLNPGLLGSGRVLDARRLAGGADSPGYMARLATRAAAVLSAPHQGARDAGAAAAHRRDAVLRARRRTAAQIYEQLRQHYRADAAEEDRSRRAGEVELRDPRGAAAAAPGGVSHRAAAGPRSTGALRQVRSAAAAARRAHRRGPQGAGVLAVHQPADAAAAAARRREASATSIWTARRAIARRTSRAFRRIPSCSLFLISLKAGGVGLNLTAAEYVFLLDPWWNPAVEMQAIDRTHRIGQKKPVFAYRLVARETVEERILELQSHKRALADAILDAGTAGLRGLQREDLEQLLA